MDSFSGFPRLDISRFGMVAAGGGMASEIRVGRKGRAKVIDADGNVLAERNQRTEALEVASNFALTSPGKTYIVSHDVTVKAIVVADPEPPPPPEPEPPPEPPSGEEIVFTGPGLGLPPTEFVRDNFTAGVIGDQIHGQPADIAGQWEFGGWSGPVYYGEVDGGRVAFHDLTNARESWSADLALDISSQDVLMGFKIRADLNDVKSRNWKTYRLFGDDNADLGNDVYYPDSGGFGAEVGGPWHWRPDHYEDGQWMDYYVAFSSKSGRGLFHFEKDGTEMAHDEFDGTGQIVRQIRIGHYWGVDPSSGAAVYTKGVYAANGLQHVRIIDQNGQTRIQVPHIWTDDEVRLVPDYEGLAAGPGVVDLVNEDFMPIRTGSVTIP